MINEAVIIAYSGHAYVVIDAAVASGLAVKYYCDKTEKGNDPFNLLYLGCEADENCAFWPTNHPVILGVGANAIRYTIAKKLLSRSKILCNVIHPKVNMSNGVTYGVGNFFAQATSISPLVTIGNFCILNTACVVEHECHLGDAVHIASGAVLAGNVQVGHRSFIGANAVIKQGVKIGNDVIIGAGAVVLHNVSDGQKLVGNPARLMKENEQ